MSWESIWLAGPSHMLILNLQQEWKREREEQLATLTSVLWECTDYLKHTVGGISQTREWYVKRKLGLRAGSQKTTDVHFSVHLPSRLKAFKAGTMNFHLRILDVWCLVLSRRLIDVLFYFIF